MKVPFEIVQQWDADWIELARKDASSVGSIHIYAIERAAEYGAAQERERCAKLCEEVHTVTVPSIFPGGTSITAAYAGARTGLECAEAIRALPNGDSNEA